MVAPPSVAALVGSVIVSARRDYGSPALRGGSDGIGAAT